MISDTTLCDLVASLYGYGTPTKWDHVFPIDGSYTAILRVMADARPVNIVVSRGSVTDLDWAEDLNAVLYNDPMLGPVHAGFREGSLAVKSLIDAAVGDEDTIYTGHSLGAGRSQDLAGWRICEGRPPLKWVLFGSPRAGCAQLVRILQKSAGFSYINADDNGHDRVTNEPPSIPPLWPYEQPSAFDVVTAPPPTVDPWLIFSYHHIQLYQAGMAKLPPLIINPASVT